MKDAIFFDKKETGDGYALRPLLWNREKTQRPARTNLSAKQPVRREYHSNRTKDKIEVKKFSIFHFTSIFI